MNAPLAPAPVRQAGIAQAVMMALNAPRGEELRARAEIQLENARHIEITSPAMFDVAADELHDLKTALKELGDRRMEITRPLDQAKKGVMELFAPATAAIESAITIVNGALVAYSTEQRRIAAARQAELDAAALAERQRLAIQAAELEATARRGAEAAAAAAAAAEEAIASGDAAAASRAAAQAAALEESSRASALSAEVAQVESAMIVAPTVHADVPKSSSVSLRGTWSAEVHETDALILAVADAIRAGGPLASAFRSLIEPSMKALNARAKVEKDKLDIPGVRAVCTESFAKSGRSA